MKSLRVCLRKPDNWKKRLELAELFHLTGDWDEAVVEWQQILAVRPNLPSVLKLGDTLLKMGGSKLQPGLSESSGNRIFNRRRPDGIWTAGLPSAKKCRTFRDGILGGGGTGAGEPGSLA